MTSAVQEVIDHELALLTAAVRLDPGRVEALLDPDFREVGASGRLWDRAAMISALVSASSAESKVAEASEMTATLMAGDLVLLTYVTNQGVRRVRRSSIWRRTNGAWRLLFHQGTLSSQ